MELDDNRVQDYQITIWWPCDHHIYDDHHMCIICMMITTGSYAAEEGELPWTGNGKRGLFAESIRSTCRRQILSEYLPLLYVFGFLISRTDCCTHPSPLPANAALEFRIDGGDQDDCDYYIDCDHEDDYGDDDDAMKWFVEINVYLSMSAWPCGISITGWNCNLVKSGCSNDDDHDSNSILIYWCPTGGKLVRVACVRKLFASYVNAPPSPM